MKKQKVKCPKCKHEFYTRSKLIKITCGSCGSKIWREENIVENGSKN